MLGSGAEFYGFLDVGCWKSQAIAGYLDINLYVCSVCSVCSKRFVFCSEGR